MNENKYNFYNSFYKELFLIDDYLCKITSNKKKESEVIFTSLSLNYK